MRFVKIIQNDTKKCIVIKNILYYSRIFRTERLFHYILDMVFVSSWAILYVPPPLYYDRIGIRISYTILYY